MRNGDDLEGARRRTILGILLVAILIVFLYAVLHPFRERQTLLVVSYDATREYFADINRAYSAEAGEPDKALVVMSHDGSVQQAQNVARGLVADVVNFASAADIEAVMQRLGEIDPGWRDQFPYRGSPFRSTIVFLVRKGNPLGIRDWDDLFDREIRIASPHPHVSGAGRFAYLAALAIASERQTEAGRAQAGDKRAAGLELLSLYTRTDLIRLGARQALDVFRRESRADVFFTWESEALRLVRAEDPGLDMVAPASSILAEPVVALLEDHVEIRGTRQLAIQYLDFLFSREGQAIAARNGLRPRLEGYAADSFPEIRLISLDEAFPPGDQVWREHFAPGGSFEELLRLLAGRRGGVE